MCVERVWIVTLPLCRFLSSYYFSCFRPSIPLSTQSSNTLKADSHIACRVHAVPLPCRAAKGLECVFPIWFTQRGCVWFTLAMPRPCPAPTMPFFSRPRHIAAVERPPVGDLPAIGFFRLQRGVTRKLLSVAYRCQMQVASLKPNNICRGRRKEWEQHTTKKTLCWTVGLAVRIFPATMRTFTKDTALSEHGRGTAWARHAMCESAFTVHFLLFVEYQVTHTVRTTNKVTIFFKF
jgi:hypothetical protein